MARNILTRDSSASYRVKQVPIDALYIRSNVVTLSSGVATVTVTFTSNVPDASYTVNATLQNTSDTNVQYQPVTITGKTLSGFTAKWNANTDSANYVLNYQTMPIV